MKKLVEQKYDFNNLLELNVRCKRELVKTGTKKDTSKFTSETERLALEKASKKLKKFELYRENEKSFILFSTTKEVKVKLSFLGSHIIIEYYNRHGNITENKPYEKKYYKFV